MLTILTAERKALTIIPALVRKGLQSIGCTARSHYKPFGLQATRARGAAASAPSTPRARRRPRTRWSRRTRRAPSRSGVSATSCSPAWTATTSLTGALSTSPALCARSSSSGALFAAPGHTHGLAATTLLACEGYDHETRENGVSGRLNPDVGT